jgi:hypothetical protein
MGFASFKNKLYKKIRDSLFLEVSYEKVKSLSDIEIDNYIQQHLYNNPKYQSPDKLNKYEFQSFSQFGEDGIIQEIFKRIGTTNKFFVEFGVEIGDETNSTYLLYQDWNGVWIDGSQDNINLINQKFSNVIKKGKLKAVPSFITAENIETLFANANVPTEFDFLSIDIDRNDYHIWNAITNYNPRVVAIEYNSIFKPGCEFVIPYEADKIWDKTSNYGASLESITKLGSQKGYILVACGFAGLNAFFVRKDLIGNNFSAPFTVENHYEPPRYFLYTKNGHPRNVIL